MSSKLERLNEALGKLIALRDKHDQTVRIGVIHIMFGQAPPPARRRSSLQSNETNRFLEWSIAFVEKGIAQEKLDLMDEE